MVQHCLRQSLRTYSLRLTLTLLLCRIMGCPSFAGRVTSQTPKVSLVIGVASRFQLSENKTLAFLIASLAIDAVVRRTEVADKACLYCIRCPFPVGDISIVMHDEPIFLESLAPVRDRGTDCSFLLTLLNFSSPPSVSLIVLIQFCALRKRLFSGSLNGPSQGSS